MNILIRCDMGGAQGWGHAVRMRALARALSQKDATVTFMTMTPALASFVAPFPTEIMGHDTPADTIEHILVIDHKYTYNPSRLREIRQHMPVVRIDDPTMTPDLCDLLVGPGQHWHPSQVETLRTAFGTRFLYGWDYVLLAPEITAQDPIPFLDRRDRPVAIAGGGSDPLFAVPQITAWCQALSLPYVAVPPGDTMGYRVGLREASMVIGMFGLTTYECLWYKTPMLVFGHTPENVEGAQELQWASGHHICAGGFVPTAKEYPPLDMVELVYRSTIQRVTEVPSLLDGLGVNRVADAICAL